MQHNNTAHSTTNPIDQALHISLDGNVSRVERADKTVKYSLREQK